MSTSDTATTIAVVCVAYLTAYFVNRFWAVVGFSFVVWFLLALPACCIDSIGAAPYTFLVTIPIGIVVRIVAALVVQLALGNDLLPRFDNTRSLGGLRVKEKIERIAKENEAVIYSWLMWFRFVGAVAVWIGVFVAGGWYDLTLSTGETILYAVLLIGAGALMFLGSFGAAVFANHHIVLDAIYSAFYFASVIPFAIYQSMTLSTTSLFIGIGVFLVVNQLIVVAEVAVGFNDNVASKKADTRTIHPPSKFWQLEKRWFVGLWLPLTVLWIAAHSFSVNGVTILRSTLYITIICAVLVLLIGIWGALKQSRSAPPDTSTTTTQSDNNDKPTSTPASLEQAQPQQQQRQAIFTVPRMGSVQRDT